MIFKQAVLFSILAASWIAGGYCVWQALPDGGFPVLDVPAKLVLSFVVPPLAATGLFAVLVMVGGSVCFVWDKTGEFVRAMEDDK